MNERAVFLAALDLDDPAGRSAYLDKACAHNPGLRRQVEELLRLHEAGGSFLATPAVEHVALPARPEHTEESWPLLPAGKDAGLRAGPETLGATRAEAGEPTQEPLDFLQPSAKPGAL